LETFQRDQQNGTFRGWLRRITENKIRDHWRRQKGQPIAEGGSDALAAWERYARDSGDAEQVASEETQQVFAEMVQCIRSEFEETTWRAFLGVTVDGRSPADVADELKISVNAVYVAKSRVLQRLRANFKQPEPPLE
jgi:RNA polymerase sigma-70 factor (ECF subfamily)